MIKKLYDQFQPTNYKLFLDINADAALFSGIVIIEGSSLNKSNEFVLHCKDLNITSAFVNDEVSDVKQANSDELILTSKSVINSGQVVIRLEFNSKITDSMHGIYPCYFEHEGKTKKIIATQFESHHAREVFPCIDEPAAKATFDVTLKSKKGQTVLGNMPVKSQKKLSDKLETVFETTPKMSTYLLAFVCGEMVMKESKTKDGVLVRSYASTAQDASWLDYSVKETVDLIEFYNDYFQIPYPLQKCDQVALPDFESGAMENWGLITYRETVLLSDPKNISLSTQQWVSLVVAHELSHQWFGNLVTMQWWDDLWLNESFANMTEYLAVDRLHPEWNIWEEFVAHDAISATNRDVYSDVQSVRVSVNDPAEISTLFDPAIVYAKGGKLLKMLHDLLGDKAWRAGLKEYFTKNAYQNTTRDDLWDALSNHTDVNIASLMNTWIEKPGQPLVTVDQKSATVMLSQRRLLLDNEQDQTLWQIPLLSEQLDATFDSKAETFYTNKDDWVLLNNSGIGHYITNYVNDDHKLWLADKLQDKNLSSTWKIARLNELTVLAKAGETSLTDALEAAKKSTTQTRAMVWSLISGILGNARMLTEGDEDADVAIKKLTRDIASENFHNLGWEFIENEDSNTTHLRSSILGLMISSESEPVVAQALEEYRATERTENLSAEIRSLILSTVSRFGTDKEFGELLVKYKSAKSADYRLDICAGLTSTRNPDQIKILLSNIVDTSVVRSQDVRYWFVYLLRNKYSRPLTWQWMKENWEWIIKTFGGSKSYDDFARYSAGFFSTPKMLEEYTNFFNDKRSDPALKRAISIGIDEIKSRVAWRKRDEANVAQWLIKYVEENQ